MPGLAGTASPYSWRMRIALLNSGVGLLAAAAEVHKRRPDADLILAMDPDGMPWGPKTPGDIAERALLLARAAAGYRPQAMILACNTGSVHALDALRAEFEPTIPVVGTVPAIKPATAAHRSVAIWATEATTASSYQRRLITDYGGRAAVTPVACPGLADAVDAAAHAATAGAIARAAERTPDDCEAVVLGCTEYELVTDMIELALPGTRAFGSAAAVAAQALRRVGDTGGAVPNSEPRSASVPPPCPSGGQGTVRVILSGRPAPLPQAALRYPAGRLLSRLAAEAGANSAG